LSFVIDTPTVFGSNHTMTKKNKKRHL